MDGSAWLNTGLQPLMSRLPKLPIDRWMSVKMLFRSSVPCSVRGAGRLVVRMVWLKAEDMHLMYTSHSY